jgi:hypothetical protein
MLLALQTEPIACGIPAGIPLACITFGLLMISSKRFDSLKDSDFKFETIFLALLKYSERSTDGFYSSKLKAVAENTSWANTNIFMLSFNILNIFYNYRIYYILRLK